eukprot:TRINITY_DN29569_c0_g1_i1.p1 TRINITY_DN29569_c0_g1~~TRINITY_DN29569_c0_g1_i1.p1  ORF type:complete len:846 (+),score=195.93 TRINITY_DN29569_c0_g1_i1:141-2678(+)
MTNHNSRPSASALVLACWLLFGAASALRFSEDEEFAQSLDLDSSTGKAVAAELRSKADSKIEQAAALERQAHDVLQTAVAAAKGGLQRIQGHSSSSLLETDTSTLQGASRSLEEARQQSRDLKKLAFEDVKEAEELRKEAAFVDRTTKGAASDAAIPTQTRPSGEPMPAAFKKAITEPQPGVPAVGRALADVSLLDENASVNASRSRSQLERGRNAEDQAEAETEVVAAAVPAAESAATRLAGIRKAEGQPQRTGSAAETDIHSPGLQHNAEDSSAMPDSNTASANTRGGILFEPGQREEPAITDSRIPEAAHDRDTNPTPASLLEEDSVQDVDLNDVATRHYQEVWRSAEKLLALSPDYDYDVSAVTRQSRAAGDSGDLVGASLLEQDAQQHSEASSMDSILESFAAMQHAGAYQRSSASDVADPPATGTGGRVSMSDSKDYRGDSKSSQPVTIRAARLRQSAESAAGSLDREVPERDASAMVQLEDSYASESAAAASEIDLAALEMQAYEDMLQDEAMGSSAGGRSRPQSPPPPPAPAPLPMAATSSLPDEPKTPPASRAGEPRQRKEEEASGLLFEDDAETKANTKKRSEKKSRRAQKHRKHRKQKNVHASSPADEASQGHGAGSLSGRLRSLLQELAAPDAPQKKIEEVPAAVNHASSYDYDYASSDDATDEDSEADIIAQGADKVDQDETEADEVLDADSEEEDDPDADSDADEDTPSASSLLAESTVRLRRGLEPGRQRSHVDREVRRDNRTRGDSLGLLELDSRRVEDGSADTETRSEADVEKSNDLNFTAALLAAKASSVAGNASLSSDYMAAASQVLASVDVSNRSYTVGCWFLAD